ncbi:MAG: T9SS type A sorting domain-containing protein, partial [Bacteroidota bacterium]
VRNHYFIKQVSTTDSVTAGLSTAINAELSEEYPVSVYPNPTADRLTVQFQTDSPGQIRLTSLSGQQLFMTQVNAGLVDQDIQTKSLDMAPGIYFVSFKAENGPSWTRKVMVINE